MPSFSRSALLVLLLALWAAIYLTNLGSSELRSEEGHRVLPAIQMIERGDYIVPYVGAQPYLLKPPLVNWIIAASFQIFHARNDWTARLPSPAFLLAGALLFFFAAAQSLGRTGASAAAFIWLTNLGLIEKGRMIEIDAIYATLFAAALVLWLIWEDRSKWLAYTIPFVFLGLGLLSKGPTLVLYFYVLVLAILWRQRRWRDLAHPAHFVGLFLMLGLFAAWLVPYFRALSHETVLVTWAHQMRIAVGGGEAARMTNWPLNFPRGLAFFLPWAVLLPFLRLSRLSSNVRRETATGLLLGSTLIFVVVLLLPGTLPRYVLPLMAPFCWILGLAVNDSAFTWTLITGRRRIKIPRPLILIAIAATILVALVVFPLRSVTVLRRKEWLKPAAAEVNAAVPVGGRIFAINPPYLPFLFYVHAPITYLARLDQLPNDARFVLIDRDYEESFLHWLQQSHRLHTSTRSASNRDTVLLTIEQR